MKRKRDKQPTPQERTSETRWDRTGESEQLVGLRICFTPVETANGTIERETLVRLSNLRWYYEMSLVPGPDCLQ